MKIKKLGIVLLASTLFCFTNPLPVLNTSKLVVHASEKADKTEIQNLLEKKKAKTIQDLETILKEEYGLKTHKPNEENYYYGDIPQDVVNLEKFYNIESYDLSNVLKVLQDEEFKKFYKYASEAFPYTWKREIFIIVEAYKELGGFEGIRGGLRDLKILEKPDDKELEYYALLALASSKEGRLYGDKKVFTFYKFPWDVFKKHPKLLAEMSAMSEFNFDYEITPEDLMDEYGKELIEIARYCSPCVVPYILNEIPREQMRKHPEKIVRIAELAKNQAGMIYEFIQMTNLIPDDQCVTEMTSVEEAGAYILYREKKLSHDTIKKIHARLNDKRLTNALEYILDKKEGLYLSDYLYELKNALILKYAKEEGLKGDSLHHLKEYFRNNKESLVGKEPKLKNYNNFLKVNREAAEVLIKACQDKSIPEYLKPCMRFLIYNCARILVDVVNLLHDSTAEREKVVSSLSPDISFFAIAQGDEVFTSSFNLLYDNLAYRLGSGQGILSQESRTEQQEKALIAGRSKVLDFISQLGQEGSELSRFVFRASYFGRLQEIIQKDKQKQEAFLKKLISYTTKRDSDAFYLAPTFESILSAKEEYKATLENLLLDNYEKEKNLVSGLIIYTYQNKMLETNKERVREVIKELEKGYGVNLGDMEVPREWFTKKEGDGMLTLRFKLYFHPETGTDNILRPAHMSIMIGQFTSQGYTQKAGKNSEVILTKVKENSKGEKVRLEFTLSNKKNLEVKEDAKSEVLILIGHRGHSYDAGKTFEFSYEFLKNTNIPFTKLIFIGSCGGFNSVPYINNDFGGKAQFIATKNMGQSLVNNAILYELADVLSEKPKKWKEAYKVIRQNIEKRYEHNSELLREFKDYSFPGDLPSLVLKYKK